MAVPAWVAALPPDLQAQKALLTALTGWCEADPAARYLVVGCSLARGNADWMSDLDMAMGVDEAEVEAVVGRVMAVLAGFGPLVQVFAHRLPTFHAPHRRVFAQYADRSQVDLVVAPSTSANLPGTVVLYDPDGLVTAHEAPAAGEAQATEWAALGWAALADLGKYLRRGSPWEAHQRLEEARAQLWKLVALAAGVAEPQFGVTSLLDAQPGHWGPAEGEPDVGEPDVGEPDVGEPGQGEPGRQWRAGMAATVAGLDGPGLRGAALALAARLEQVEDGLAARDLCRPPVALARFVRRDLEALGQEGGDERP